MRVSHRKTLGYVSRYDVCLSYDLTKKKKKKWVLFSSASFCWNKTDPFFNRINTGDEKWMVYNNMEQEMFCPTVN